MDQSVNTFERDMVAYFDALPTTNLESRYAGAWYACDEDTARRCVEALRRRGADVSKYRWGA